MNLFWLEQAEADVPAEDNWLGSCETVRLSGFRFAKRRADWRLGRWTAKQAVASSLNVTADAHALAGIEIRPASSGAPEVFIENRPVPLVISLSHRAGRAMCAIGPANLNVGCDLEVIEPHSDAFIADYLTAEEQQLIAGCGLSLGYRTVPLLWSAKESALKALHEGLRVDPRTVTVSLEPEWSKTEGWGQLQVHYGNQFFSGWWEEAGNFVRTIVADARSGVPIRLSAMFEDLGEDRPLHNFHRERPAFFDLPKPPHGERNMTSQEQEVQCPGPKARA